MSMMASTATFEEYSSNDGGVNDIFDAFKSLGKRRIKRRSTSQEKRDISLSYAATDIHNKEGTQIKTITVIKNLNNKNQKLKINPELHKTENWHEAFKDNFDSYGIIPDVPDVDDLFEYVNKKHKNYKKKNNETQNNDNKFSEGKKDEEEMTTKSIEKSYPMEMEKPVTEISAEISEEIINNIKAAEKVKGDAELLPNFNSSRPESLINLNYSEPVQQYFENYVQLSQNGKTVGGYDYLQSCIHSQPIGSVTVATSSGKTYNIPGHNNSYINPYLAPDITRRPHLVQQQPTRIPQPNSPLFPINSLVPSIHQQQNNSPAQNTFLIQQNLDEGTAQHQPQQQNTFLPPPIFQNNFKNNQPQQNPQQQQSQQNRQQVQNYFSSTSQRPYVSQSVRSGLGGVSRGPSSTSNANGFQNGQPSYRVNTFNNGFRKPNIFRSRGLKY